jgi:ferritin-like metal-binding protein YciE
MSDNYQTITTLGDLLEYDIRKFYSAELQLETKLEKWVVDASSLKLKTVIQRYREKIIVHKQKMEEYLQEENISAAGFTDQIMAAFIDDTEERLNICRDAEVKDACLLANLQAINHYKISLYGTAAAFANSVGKEKYSLAFHEASVSEIQIDDRLTQLAAYEINQRARTPLVLPE